MARRIVWAVLLGALFLFFLLQSSVWVIAVIGVAHVVGQWEFLSLHRGMGKVSRAVFAIAASLLWLGLTLALGRSTTAEWTTVSLTLAGLILGVVWVLGAARTRVFFPAPLALSLLLVTLPLSLLATALNRGNGSITLLLIAGASWGADTGAIFAGKLTGQTPLAVRLSPGKTVEGVVGGMLSAGAVWVGAGVLYGSPIELLAPVAEGAVGWTVLMTLLVLGAATSLVGVFGDLAFSTFKRATGVKDYGTLIPGHGGLLDRIDSLLFVTPVVYLLSTS